MKFKTLFLNAMLLFVVACFVFPLVAGEVEIGSYEGKFSVGTTGGKVYINTGIGVPETCGNGAIDVSTEQCDGNNLGEASCSSVLGSSYSGTLSCLSSCVYDISMCSTSNVVEPVVVSSGGGGGRSSRKVVLNNTPVYRLNEVPVNESDDEEIEINEDEEISGWSAFTGAVIGALKSGGIIPVLIFMIILVAAVVALRMRKVDSAEVASGETGAGAGVVASGEAEEVAPKKKSSKTK